MKIRQQGALPLICIMMMSAPTSLALAAPGDAEQTSVLKIFFPKSKVAEHHKAREIKIPAECAKHVKDFQVGFMNSASQFFPELAMPTNALPLHDAYCIQRQLDEGNITQDEALRRAQNTPFPKAQNAGEKLLLTPPTEGHRCYFKGYTMGFEELTSDLEKLEADKMKKESDPSLKKCFDEYQIGKSIAAKVCAGEGKKTTLSKALETSGCYHAGYRTKNSCGFKADAYVDCPVVAKKREAEKPVEPLIETAPSLGSEDSGSDAQFGSGAEGGAMKGK